MFAPKTAFGLDDIQLLKDNEQDASRYTTPAPNPSHKKAKVLVVGLGMLIAPAPVANTFVSRVSCGSSIAQIEEIYSQIQIEERNLLATQDFLDCLAKDSYMQADSVYEVNYINTDAEFDFSPEEEYTVSINVASIEEGDFDYDETDVLSDTPYALS